jgi:hypothetical protein
MYVVRVNRQRSVTFTVSSQFDSFLSLLRLNSFTNTTADWSFVAEDDDGTGGLDARLTVTLQPNVDYLLAISGFDYNETGPYTIRIE